MTRNIAMVLFCLKVPVYLGRHSPTQASVESTTRLMEFYLCEDLMILGKATFCVQRDIVQNGNQALSTIKELGTKK